MNGLVLPKPTVLIEGKIESQISGKQQTFYIADAGRTYITAYFHNDDGRYFWYKGLAINAGDRDGEREWMQAWVKANAKEPWIRVDHRTKTIEIVTFNMRKVAFMRGDIVLLLLPALNREGTTVKRINCVGLEGDVAQEGTLYPADHYVVQTRQSAPEWDIAEGKVLDNVRPEDMTHTS